MLSALLRSDPELHGYAVAVADDNGPRAKLLAVSTAAVRRGVRCGASIVQAKAIGADLIVRSVSPDMRRATQAALCDVAGSFSPRIEDSGDGV
ncbi:MAG TPA: hypothetical protein VMT89_07430, partial [Candidatus Acidoferrales bacterium]|nr:hypothetical protein [Candidatus Acidoferrales bacterium]